jgi:UDP-N-acetylglucosamine 1-carboxyvinyltransferase
MDEALLIEGGATLEGEIDVRGAKNHILKVMASSLLFDGPIEIENVPLIEDVFRMSELLKNLGIFVRKKGERNLVIDSTNLNNYILEPDISKKFRASIVVVGPLISRLKKAIFPYPGGCVIGKRPIDLFLEGWRKLGVKIKAISNDEFELEAKNMKGTNLFFRVSSVTATEALMMSAVLLKGKTTLYNAAMEPEIVALAEFLNSSGARIFGAGTPTIVIEGTNGKLLRQKEPCKIIPDRIEAGSFLIIGALAGKNILVKNCIPSHMQALICSLRDSGVKLRIGEDWIEVSRPKVIRPVDIKTKEYPGFPTDLQAPFSVFLTQAKGSSSVFETIFENRFAYVEDINRMGANIVLAHPQRIIINGPTPLRGRDIETPDLRAGLAFLGAALIASGKTILRNVYQIDRGYETIEKRLLPLGANIKRIKT